MQVVQVANYRRIATDNRVRIVPLRAPRGVVYDRNKIPLINNRPSFAISVLPTEFQGDQPRLQLANALEIPQEELRRRLSKRGSLPFEPVGVQIDADFRTVCRLQENLDQFPGVVVGTESVREYPAAGWGGHVLGYVREVSPEDQSRMDRLGRPLRGLVGAIGLEKRYDDVVRGVDGVRHWEVNALGQLVGPMPGYPDVSPIPGNDLMLALDANLQTLADSLLSTYDAGTVVAVDVRTGEVLCFVTRPGYDANAFSGTLSSDEWSRLRDDPLKPLLNRAAKGLYPPGSTSKLLTAGAALEAGVVGVGDHFGSCGGGYRFGNRVFGCWRPGGHGALDMFGAVEQSCDVYFYQLGLKVGLDKWSKSVLACGFGRATGIDLPGEVDGLVPSTEYYDRRFGRNRWSKGLMLNLAIGQGEFLVTPVQLLQYFAALANNGVAMKPHLLLATRATQRSWEYQPPVVAFRLPYSQSTLAILQESARLVVYGAHGTAGGIRDDSVRMAGKTGTAQNPHGNEHSWFAGYAPSEAPQIAVVALVENAGHGSAIAAPICFKIAKAYFSGTATGGQQHGVAQTPP
jgi:penicillin-binding protein 2